MQTYICKHEDWKSVRGIKAMIALDRVTGYVCASATSIHVPICIIETAKNPKCFQIEPWPVSYLSRRNAWSDTVTFKRWYYDAFLPFARHYSSVSLLMDSCGSYGADLSGPRGQVTIMTLPSNCTSLYQPMDMGIISTWKLKCRSLLVRAIVNDLDSRHQRRDDKAALLQGMRRLSEGRVPHLLDIETMV